MKTIILSGPGASGKTTQAHRLIREISPEEYKYYEIFYPDIPVIQEIMRHLEKEKCPTVLMECAPPSAIESVGVNLYENGFKGTFIATTKNTEIDVVRLIDTHAVRICFLHREENGLLIDRIADVITPIVHEHNAEFRHIAPFGHPPQYKYIFPDGTEVSIKSGCLI
ncbi:hypothetical protein [Proteiniphilum sp.]|uniref:hypothetical protein n=1 Tax=Proteiniphilum sp. TaxID=1926877 RepID=UPI00331C025B